MSENVPNFALPGLMQITRPRLDEQRLLLRMPPHRLQDSLWTGIPSVGPIRPGGVQPTFPLALVTMVFDVGLPVGNEPLFTLSSAAGKIVIDNPVTWLCHIPATALPLGLGNYFWEIHTTDTQGNETVYYTGTQLISA